MTNKCIRCGRPNEAAGDKCPPCKERERANRAASRARKAAGAPLILRPYTAAEDATVMRLRSQGVSVSVIAQKIGRSKGGLQQRIFRLELAAGMIDADAGDDVDNSADKDGRYPYPPLRIEDFMRSGGSASGL